MVENKNTASQLQSKSPIHEVSEISQEDQSKGDKLKMAAGDIPLQSNVDKEVKEVERVADDPPPAGISDEKSKNATEQKVKANATSSCQLL